MKMSIPSKIVIIMMKQNRLLLLDNTLPRTKDYICPNTKCESHKNINKEAIFYRPDKNSYRLEYQCAACRIKWDVRNKTL